MRRPISVDPVKERTRTSLDFVIALTTSRTSPVTTLITPSGNPARRASSASARAENGASFEGWTTQVHPAASAAAALRVIMAQGKFHGVIKTATPIGFRCTDIDAPERWDVTPSIF